jgi:Fe2+ transport system protein FeoA
VQYNAPSLGEQLVQRGFGTAICVVRSFPEGVPIATRVAPTTASSAAALEVRRRGVALRRCVVQRAR